MFQQWTHRLPFFTAPCTIVQGTVLLSHVVCPSVRLSVTLVDQDDIRWKSVKLIAGTISTTTSLFVAKTPSTYSRETWENFEETRGGWGKVACWSTKAAISLKSVKIEEKLLWGPIGTHQRTFERYHARPPTASPSPRLGFSTPTQNSNRYYLRNGYSYGLQTWPIHSQGPFEQHPIRKFGEKGAWAHSGTSKYFWVRHIISGTGKTRNFKFGRTIHSVHPNRSPLKIFEKMERGHIQGLPKFLWYPLLTRERVTLQTSNFVGTFIVSIGTHRPTHSEFREK